MRYIRLVSFLMAIGMLFSCSPAVRDNTAIRPSPNAGGTFSPLTAGEGENTYLEEKNNPLPSPVSSELFRKMDLKKDEIEYFEAAANGLSHKRDISLKPFETMRLMGLKEGDTIGDIGCGCGYHVFRFSRVVGPGGRVYAVDINPVVMKYLEAVMAVEKQKTGEEFRNVTLINNSVDNVMVPENTLDFAFLCETHIFVCTQIFSGQKLEDYDEAYKVILEGNREFVGTIHTALKPRGRLVIIERSREMNPAASLDKAGTIKILETLGFTLEKDHLLFEDYYMLIFKKTQSG